MQIFRPGATSIARVILALMAAAPVAIVGIAYAVTRSSYVTGQDVTRHQPIPFSHAHHVNDDGIDWRYCHASAEKTRFAGMPSTDTCMTCHSQLWTNAEVLVPVRQSLAEGRPLRWTRVHRLPDYVYFDHSVHVANGVGCSTCHGAVETMPLMRQVAPLTMAWCIDCHRDPAPWLRPRNAVFDQSWQPTSNQEEEGRKLLAEYHIDAAHLTDCSRCHR
jgi:hypothetical protein